MDALEYSLLHPTTIVEEITEEQSVTDPGEYVSFYRYWLNGESITFQESLKHKGIPKTIHNTHF